MAHYIYLENLPDQKKSSEIFRLFPRIDRIKCNCIRNTLRISLDSIRPVTNSPSCQYLDSLFRPFPTRIPEPLHGYGGNRHLPRSSHWSITIFSSTVSFCHGTISSSVVILLAKFAVNVDSACSSCLSLGFDSREFIFTDMFCLLQLRFSRTPIFFSCIHP